MQDIIVNKVAQSGLITLDLETYYSTEEIISFDLKEYLFMELILKEKDFRDSMKAIDWTVYQDKIVALHCSADAIIPLWAYMLVTSLAEPYAKEIHQGSPDEIREQLFLNNISSIDSSEFTDKRVVVKGCADKKLPAAAYIEITKKLRPVVKTLMYGEPCSTVPVYKKK